MKFFARVVLNIIADLYIVCFFLMALPQVLNYKTSVKFKQSYVSSINTSYYSEGTIKEILNEFNKKGDDKIVQFNKIEGGRPITINEVTDDNIVFKVLFPEAIGITYPLYDKCTIYLLNSLSYDTLRETVIHEYLHCFNYEHVSDRSDLMYEFDNNEDKEASINKYAKDLEAKYGQ
jgi:hypothetical protein